MKERSTLFSLDTSNRCVWYVVTIYIFPFQDIVELPHKKAWCYSFLMQVVLLCCKKFVALFARINYTL